MSPNYHVYVFVRDGIRYIQINTRDGTVRAAMAIADKVVLVLPVGVDAGYVTNRQGFAQSVRPDNTGVTETIYRDSSTRITATPAGAGVLHINVATTATADPAICTNPANCNGVGGRGKGKGGNGQGGDGGNGG